MIRSRIILILICSSVLYCCNKSSKTEEKVIQEKVKDTTIYKVSKDTTIKRESSARVYFTKNPIILKSNIFNLDSLDRFFKFKDIDRIDKLDTVLFTWYEDSLKEIVFPTRIIEPILSKDIIQLGHYQFLLEMLEEKVMR